MGLAANWSNKKRGLLFGLATALSLTACGGGGGSTTQPPPPPPTSPDVQTASVRAAPIQEVNAPVPQPFDRFGARSFLRNNGKTLVVAAPGDPIDPNTGIPQLSPFFSFGSAYVFARSVSGGWTKTA